MRSTVLTPVTTLQWIVLFRGRRPPNCPGGAWAILSRDDDEPSILATIRELGCQLVPIKLPDQIPSRGPLTVMLSAEAATVFDPLTRAGTTEDLYSWPATFREAEYYPAVEYLRASRARTMLMYEMRRLMATVDVYVGGRDLLIANLTGHPSVVLPNSVVPAGKRETPEAITFTGQLYGESKLLLLAHRYQQLRGHHLQVPPLKDEALE